MEAMSVNLFYKYEVKLCSFLLSELKSRNLGKYCMLFFLIWFSMMKHLSCCTYGECNKSNVIGT